MVIWVFEERSLAASSGISRPFGGSDISTHLERTVAISPSALEHRRMNIA
ncbi:MAG: hypothetical protein II021_00390 [Oscillospiraceae bacterium]|nr:hypothetical protein [Oscillospiraceae bacterium]